MSKAPGKSAAPKAPRKRKGVQVCNGPTTGYRDAPKGEVCGADFPDGFLPEGWEDTPAKCKNYSGDGHGEYVRVRLTDGKWLPVE